MALNRAYDGGDEGVVALRQQRMETLLEGGLGVSESLPDPYARLVGGFELWVDGYREAMLVLCSPKRGVLRPGVTLRGSSPQEKKRADGQRMSGAYRMRERDERLGKAPDRGGAS